MLWAEVQTRLVKKAEKEVCRQCCKSLLNIIGTQPYRLTEKVLEDEGEGHCSVEV